MEPLIICRKGLVLEIAAQVGKHLFTQPPESVSRASMASRLVLLPTLLVALAFVMLCAPSFVFGGQPASTTSLRSSTARAAVPEALELQTSMTTALEVSTPGWWANIVTLVVPIAILIVLYLQSEKRIYEEQMGKWVFWPFENVWRPIVFGRMHSETQKTHAEKAAHAQINQQRALWPAAESAYSLDARASPRIKQQSWIAAFQGAIFSSNNYLTWWALIQPMLGLMRGRFGSRSAPIEARPQITLRCLNGFQACVASYPPGGIGLCDAVRSFLRVRWSACIHYLLAKQHGTGGSARSFGIADFHDHCTGGFHPWLVGQHCDLGGAHCHLDRPLPSVREAHLWGTNGQVSGLEDNRGSVWANVNIAKLPGAVAIFRSEAIAETKWIDMTTGR